MDWFNVLVAQTIAQLRNDAQHEDAILTTLNRVLNGDRRPDFLGPIRVTEINLGEEFPIFSNCRVMPVMDLDSSGRPPSSSSNMQGGGGTGSRLQARMDVDLADNLTIGIETKLVLNYPKPSVAVMPVALAVSVVRFSATLSISFIPSPSSSETFKQDQTRDKSQAGSSIPPSPTLLTFSFQPDYRLELSTRSLLGSKSRLQDVPKIAQLVEARLHAWFDERCVEPRFQRVVLPSLWPRRENAGTRGEPEPDSSTAGDGPSLGEDDSALATEYSPKVGPDGEGIRNRRARAREDSIDAQHHHLRLSEPSAFELPGSMPGSLPM